MSTNNDELRLGSSFWKEGVEKCQGRLCVEAISMFEQAVLLQPTNPEPHYRLGVCYGGGCRLHSLTEPDIAVEHLRHALPLASESGDDLLRATILDALGNTYLRSRGLPAEDRLEAAIDCFQVAAEIYWNRDQLDDWAREEHNLGNTWCEMPEKRFPGKWLEAITHYEKALVVRTRERDRERHAATLQNLGTAYRELPAGDRTENVVRAIHCYRRAIGIYRFAAFAIKNAGLHNNLGNAYLSLPFTGEAAGCRNALRALRHLDRALRVRTRTAYPCDYAITQYNRGQALLLLAATDARAEPGMAAKCFEEAYECFLQCGQSEYGQMVLRRLGQLGGHRPS